MATISRLLKITGLFCRISSVLWGSFAKKTYNFKEPTHRSHPIAVAIVTHAQPHARTHTYTQTHTHTQPHARTHAHTHTRTRVMLPQRIEGAEEGQTSDVTCVFCR